MEPKISGKTSKWKWAFLTLLALNVAFLAIVMLRLGPLNGGLTQEHETFVSKNDVKVGTFTSTRDEFNETVASYFEEYQGKNNQYTFSATSSDIVFKGSYKVLGYDIPLEIYFTPVVLNDGSIQLEVSSVSAGSLSLPKKDVLKVIAASYDFPDFVEINAKKTTIILNLPKLKNEADIYVKATELDLVNNHLNFDIYKKS